MKFTKEVLDGLKEEFKEYDLPINLLAYLFLKAKVMSSHQDGYVDEFYYSNVRELIEIYNLGKEKYIPTKDDILEERNFHFE
jgi:hypothetical protein